jgi:hypothetical protein
VIDAFLEMYRQRVIFAFVAVRLIAVVWVATVGAAQAQELFSARCFGGFEVYNEFKHGRLQYRQIGRFFALENPAGIDPYLTIGVGRAGSITHQPTG